VSIFSMLRVWEVALVMTSRTVVDDKYGIE